mmetsp:Transcript_28244/g.50969  ORF Transcript_28244/g.50969 Transcript_28244/m.50969 type:complete len:163 (-) Transcript_28244:112-600(-)|eukprot:CAMPEP_0197642996 /NCGR_PEP_ID=MMETSP1338-20131121/16482_1 /TAXON_ID=43686 ORGANISM="Pelagodinium beii, Strain RCC1491" /NCGR_SAMPLE_ID=MMETSP1338 /ASSEMBLY_ACC=CAM_ASM_000754 /LENGTH=162 /DNA_ID=CAMNT_0043216201 /DNA_START=92 /DNA_END=580 /DNA_ORIENTATION=+
MASSKVPCLSMFVCVFFDITQALRPELTLSPGQGWEGKWIQVHADVQGYNSELVISDDDSGTKTITLNCGLAGQTKESLQESVSSTARLEERKCEGPEDAYKCRTVLKWYGITNPVNADVTFQKEGDCQAPEVPKAMCIVAQFIYKQDGRTTLRKVFYHKGA